MASLTQTAITTRKIVRYGIFFIIFLMVGKLVLDASISVYKRLFPAPPPPPTVTFGKLPSLIFPESSRPTNLSFTLETPEGGLPTNLPTQLKVYFMPKISANLLSLDFALQKASELGFLGDAQELSSTLYRFPHRENPSHLDVNIITGIFSISYDLATDPTPIERKPPTAEIAASIVRSYLSAADSLPIDLEGAVTHEFLKLKDNKFVGALSLSESDLIKVNFFRSNYDELPVLTPKPSTSNTWFIVSGSGERSKQVLAAEFHYFPIDVTKFATYPIKTPEVAWSELTGGGGYISSMGQNPEGRTIIVRRVYLGYYDQGTPSDFFQPIYVFEGDNGFIAYVPAISDEYYGE